MQRRILSARVGMKDKVGAKLYRILGDCESLFEKLISFLSGDSFFLFFRDRIDRKGGEEVPIVGVEGEKVESVGGGSKG